MVSTSRLRPYQVEAVEGIETAWARHGSTLVVAATGTGKTQIFAHVIRERLSLGRAIVIAHREELIEQAAHRVAEIAECHVDIEMADRRAGDGTMWGGAPLVVASIQSLNSRDRLQRFDPDEYATLVVDEAHHATADAYRRVIEYFRRNPNLKLLGVTATPDRKDEEALGQIFTSVAYDYEIIDAVIDGWLVRPLCRTVKLAGLDLSGVRTTAGDFNGRDLESAMRANENLEAIAAATIEHAGNRATIVFSDSVTDTERVYEGEGDERELVETIVREGNAPKLTEMLNGHRPGCARLIHGRTPKDERRELISNFRAGGFQFLVNVGVATEGFDAPETACIVLARPTKSRALCSQMCGRGTRPTGAIADLLGELPNDVARREAIADSTKPDLLIVDFTDNTDRHDLIHPPDILGGRVSDRAVEQVKADCQGKPTDIIEALGNADDAIRHNDELQAARDRAGVKARQKYSDRDPFAIYGLSRRARHGYEPDQPPEDWQVEKLERWGVKGAHKLDWSGAQQIIDEYRSRARRGLCTIKQQAILRKHGYEGDVTYETARAALDEISKAWR